MKRKPELPPDENSAPIPNPRRISASFSRRLRHRFSRESRQSGEHRVVFPFSLKSKPSTPKADTEMSVFGDMGSSLMSARGYDSDAQFVGSPQHIENLKASPRSPALRGIGLTDVIETSPERNHLERWASADGQGQPTSPGAFGMRFLPTPQDSMRGRNGSGHMNHPTETTGSHVMHSFNNQRPGEQNNFAKSLPSLHLSQEQLVPPNSENFQHRVGYLTSSSGENLRNLVADWAQYLESNPGGRNASSESLGDRSPKILVSKRRQHTSTLEAHSETRAPYLGDVHSSQRLTGPIMPSGPPSANPSMLNLPDARRYGRQIDHSENFRSDATSGASTPSQSQAMLHHRDVSSLYSRQSDEAPGRASSAVHSLRVHAANAINSLPSIQARMLEEAASSRSMQEASGAVDSDKFVHQLEAANSVSPYIDGLPNGIGGIRKVSPGWMTGGRRMGYGFSLVDNVEESPRAGAGDECTLPRKEYDHQAPELTADTPHDNGTDSPVKQQAGLQLAIPPATPNGEHRMNSSHCAATQTLNDPKSDAIPNLSQWARMKKHSVRAQKRAPLAADLAGEGISLENPQCSGAIPTQLNHSPTPLRAGYVEDNDNFLGRWSRGSFSLKKQAQLDRNEDPNSGRKSFTPETSPIAQRRFSMDQRNGRASIYFDPSNERSADQLNRQPSRSRSGRWILRFSRKRDSKKHTFQARKECLQDPPVQYPECASSGLARSLSARSDLAADLANEYQECIQMPGAFYGSGWASRTSLIVEAE